MPNPPKTPPDNPPSIPPTDPPLKKRGNPDNLAKGLTPNQERGPDGKIRVKKPPEPPLSTEAESELLAMQRVASHPPTDDRTWQHRNLRKWLDESPAAFYARVAKLKEAEPATSPTAHGCAVDWNGVGDCPTCKRPPEEFPEDMGDDRVGELLKDEVDLVEEYFKYRAEFKAWLGQTKGARV
jgi:hypothetical protein